VTDIVFKRDADGNLVGIDFEASARARDDAKAHESAPAKEPKQLVVFVREGARAVEMDYDAASGMSDQEIDKFLARKPPAKPGSKRRKPHG
jgi:hypothetical protein